jgi:hypothetical protein
LLIQWGPAPKTPGIFLGIALVFDATQHSLS